MDKDISELSRIDQRVADLVSVFRQGKMGIIPGGGGEYGRLAIGAEARQTIAKQRTLGEY